MNTIHRFVSLFVRLGCGVALAGALGGCYAYAEPGYVEADYVPPDITVYPSAYYEGRTVYLVDGRWYYQNQSHWVYLREEPTVLYQQRVRIQAAPSPIVRQNAPRAYPPPRYSAPPVYRENAPASPRVNAPRAYPRPDRDRDHDRDRDRR